MGLYRGEWTGHADVLRDMMVSEQDLPAEQTLYASYDIDGYEGGAWLVFQKDGQLFEVSASHCSCNDLTGQWTPEATTREAIAMRRKDPRAMEALSAIPC